jgi:CrcB protein
MNAWLAVALGSALGGVARHGVARLWPMVPGAWPVATMSVNIAGSFAIGLLAALFMARGSGDTARLFWMTGVLGGFTTYSAFALETVTLAAAGAAGRAAFYVAATVALCLVAAVAGRTLGLALAGD